jgi:hypothetical protein
MAEPHLDHPGEIHWFRGYGPSTVLGPCPHPTCPHNAQSVIGWGPSYERYELVQCDIPEHCDGGCRAWANSAGAVVTDWLEVEAKERVLSGGVTRA